MPKYRFSQLVDIEELQKLMDLFQEATLGIASAIIEPDGTILVASGWQAACTQFHRANPKTEARCLESDAYINARLEDREREEPYIVYKCKNGLYDLAVPIIVQGEHLCSIFTGQLFFEDDKPDEAFFRQQAEQFGFDVEAYLEAIDQVPVHTRDQVYKIMDFYAEFAKFLAETGLDRMELEAKELSLKESQKQLEQLLEERERLNREIVAAHQQAIQELSTPVIPVMEGIIVMPMVGSIDTMRAKDLMRALLAGIREQRASVVILDITGVPIVDSGVANHLNKTVQAARLKGARTIVTGISDAVAETIVDLGIDWSDIETLPDLQTGLLVALNSMGIKLSRSGNK